MIAHANVSNERKEILSKRFTDILRGLEIDESDIEEGQALIEEFKNVKLNIKSNSGKDAFHKAYEKLAYSYIFGFPPSLLDPFEGDLPFLKDGGLPLGSDYDDHAIIFLENLL